MKRLTDMPEWQMLKLKFAKLAKTHMRDMFANDPHRGKNLSLEAAGLYLDYSKNRIDEETLHLFGKLAEACDLRNQMESLFEGKLRKGSMQISVVHPALRNLDLFSINLEGRNFTAEVKASWEKLEKISERIREGDYKGFTGKPIIDIVNIGMGGSFLGQQMIYYALKHYTKSTLRCHFISNLDATNAEEVLQRLNPETTLFIITSKSLTTKETLENTSRAKRWLMQAAKEEKLIRPHFMAATSAPGKAYELNVPTENVFIMWPWVGGRFSVWSSAGLCIAMAIGWENFYKFLSGAHAMDKHFRNAEFLKNMPVLLALLSIWYINFFGNQTQAIISYSQRLYYLLNYLKQLHMESQGKSVQIDGSPVNYDTGPVVWGGVGTDSQHSFHQLFMQGTFRVPIDFIAVLKRNNEAGCQFSLLANCLGQSETLMRGYDKKTLITHLIAQGFNTQEAEKLASQREIRGNNPSNTIVMEKLTPYTLGSLLALYEHKVYVQSEIWNINAFDQWGVEQGKRLAEDILASFEGKIDSLSFDSSTTHLINYAMNKNKNTETVS